MNESVSPKDEIWFLRVCHHISTGLYLHSGGRGPAKFASGYAVLHMAKILEFALRAKILICYLSMYVQLVTVGV